MITDKDKTEKKFFYAAILLFIVYAVIGLFFFDDYGCGPDEGMERQTALVNFKYAIQKFHIPISEENKAWMEYLPDLHEYRDRYYGTALHFPLVLIESAYHFKLEPSQFYGMRHFYTFFNVYIGLICFYKLLTNRFGSRKYGFFAVLMMILTPRFFAESFYNNKDIIFVAWYIICSYLMDKWFRKKSLKSSVMLAFALAITCNTRFNGIIFLPILIALFVFDTFRSKKLNHLNYLMLTIILTLLFFYMITPNFWEKPFQTLLETFQFNLHHPNHGSDGNLFKGILVDAAATYTYIPTWIIITTPVVYILFMISGACKYVFDAIRNLFKIDFGRINLADLMMFVSGYAAVIFIIIKHVTIYNGWRHCYFAYPCFVYFAIYFFNQLDAKKAALIRYAVYSVTVLSCLYNMFWIIRNHPFEYVYFSPVARNNPGDYSGDYWSVSSRALLEYIMENEPGRVLKINHAHSQAGSINRGLFPEETRDYIILTYDQTDDVDYYIVCRDDIPSVDIDLKGYKKVYAITVDNDQIGAVFQKEVSQ